jgi:hypothetical protein
MAKGVTFDIQGLKGVQKKIKNLPATLQKQIGGELNATVRDINSKQLRKLPVDEGGLKQQTGFKKLDDLQWELFSGKHYAPFMEFGTKSKARIPAELKDFASQFNLKGPKIGFDEFLRIITAWVRRKGIAGRFSVKTRRRVGSKATQAAEDSAAAYPIALSILRHGVKPHPFFFDPVFEGRDKLIQKIKQIVDNI